MIEQLLEDHKITRRTIADLLTDLSGKNADYADLYFQHSTAESWILEDDKIKQGSFHITHGVGVRSMSGEQSGFAYTDDFDIASLKKTARFAAALARAPGKIHPPKNIHHRQNYANLNPLDSLSAEEKVNLIRRTNAILKMEKKVEHATVSLSGAYTEILVAASDGTYQIDRRPMVRIGVHIIVAANGRREHGTSGGGGRYDYRYFVDNHFDEIYAQDAIRQALVALKAKHAPAGKMPVILGAGWPGVLLHEAIGHGLEGDFNRKGTSVFSGKIGERIATEKCTVVDNGALANRRGSLSVDDEGTPTQKTILIENGILKNYLLDKQNARLLKMKPTGNARRESYAHLPMPRMTNTYLIGGSDNFDEMVRSVDFGIYAVNFDGGQVDITSGDFVFSANEAYLIENGKIKHPLKGATLAGKGSEVLKKITMVGDDLRLDPGVGVCGKNGQSVAVGVGQPSLKINELTVGGTEVAKR